MEIMRLTKMYILNTNFVKSNFLICRVHSQHKNCFGIRERYLMQLNFG